MISLKLNPPRYLPLFVCVTLLAACGQRGPLYLPNEDPKTAVDSAVTDSEVDPENESAEVTEAEEEFGN